MDRNQFDNARSRTSGSQSPSSSFALAAGNTNPQGIADPPAAVGDRHDSLPLPVIDGQRGRSVGFDDGARAPSVLVPWSSSDEETLTLLAAELIGSAGKRRPLSHRG